MSGPRSAVRSHDVAIIGMAGRFPGAPTLEAFWQTLRDGVESITAFSRDELRAAGAARHVIADDSFVKAGGVLADVGAFDAEFFGLSPAEAEVMDPQQRVFLECAWAALEDAGYGAHETPQQVGVYAGTSMSSYLLNVLLPGKEERPVSVDLRTLIGNDKDHLTARVAYRLDLVGPAVTVQTACSTSLVAVHLAAQALLAGDCEMALAGGVSIGIPQVAAAAYTKGGIIARDGHCRPFDAAADGTVGGCGAGVVVLKGLAEALADRDHIRAVIKGSAIRNDGRAKVGYSAPSQLGQMRTVRAALDAAEVAPDTIDYVEAHGTATPLGDPIEIAALAQVYSGVPPGSCLIGTVKASIGHLDAAAGIAGLIKTVLCLEHREIAPSLNFRSPNPELHLESTPFRVCSSLTPWPAVSGPRRAAVSAFGIGGTNAHVILEEAPSRLSTASDERRSHLLRLSARSAEALDVMASRLADALEANTAYDLADVAFTLAAGRSTFEHRLAITCTTTDEAVSALRDRRFAARSSARPGLPIVFLFPGQDAPLARAGETLRRRSRLFASVVDQCAELLRPLCGFDIRAALAGENVGPDATYRLTDTIVAQPAVFTLEYALARMWMDWGFTPAAMAGHSLGEYVAACVADVLSLESALRVVAERGRVMQEAAAGGMVAVALGEHDLEAFLAAEDLPLDIAAVNGERHCTLAGPTSALAIAKNRLNARRIAVRAIAATRAFHSRAMTTAAERIGALVAAQRPAAPVIPYVSTYTGRWVGASEVASERFWSGHTTGAVRFSNAIATLSTLGRAAYLEVGRGDSLTRLVKSSGHAAAEVVVSSLPHAAPEVEERDIQTALGALWVGGATVRWSSVAPDESACRVALPVYPFERRHHWSSTTAEQTRPAVAADRDVASWLYAPAWRCVASGRLPPNAASSHPRERWAVIHDGSARGAELIAILRTDGAQVIEVLAGERFSVDGPSAFTVDYRRADSFNDLAAALTRADDGPLRVVHVWSRTAKDVAGATLGAYDCVALLHLARALTLVAGHEGPAVRLIAVTEGAHAVAGEVIERPLHAAAAGACRSIALEATRLRCVCIDLPEGAPRSAIEQLARALLTDVSHPLLAIRGTRIFTSAIDRLAPNGATLPSLLRHNGVYLITGGLGGVGLTIAAHLAATARAKLLLVSRRAGLPLPAALQERLAALRAAASSVLVLEGDVASESDMQRVLTTAVAEFGQIHGLVHAAGVPAAGMLLTPQEALVAAAYTAKVQGTLVLGSVFRQMRFDFVTLCSSLAAVNGAPGQAAYAAANAFLDAVPYTDLFHDAVVQSIAWDTWRDVGMAVEVAMPAELEPRRQESLRTGLSPNEGARIFSMALDTRDPRLIVSTRDPRRGRDHDRPAASRAVSPPAVPVEPGGRPLRIVETDLCRIWSEALHLAVVRPDDNVFEFGADSLIALQVVASIEHRFGCELSPIICYEAPTPRLLARAVTNASREGETFSQSEARGVGRRHG